MVLDYIQDMNNNYWIIYYQLNGIKYGYPVYQRCDNGNRIHPVSGLYYKKNKESIYEIPTSYKNVYHPKDCFMQKKDQLPDIWKKFVEAMHIVGIANEDLGIFGSTLCGFPILKDVDFIIYGKENLEKYYKNQLFIKAYMDADYISKEHVEYQYKKYKSLYSPKMDLKRILSNNWSGIQLNNGVLSTPRFITTEFNNIPYVSGCDEFIEGTVFNSLTASCTPRYFSLSVNQDSYTVITPFWMLQSCVKDGDRIKIFGKVNHKEKIIMLLEYKHYLSF